MRNLAVLPMTIEAYKNIIAENGFNEHPSLNNGKHLLCRFLRYEDADTDLLIYLNVLILCRSYYGTYTAYYDDVKWFQEGFYQSQQPDFLKPHLTETIASAANMILNGNDFTEGIIGTTFMFGVLEYYAKAKLGFRPLDYDFFDKKGKKQYVQKLPVRNKNLDLSIDTAFEQLKSANLPVSLALDEIDEFTTTGLMGASLHPHRWIVYRISERLSLARNPMLHGESHSFYSIGSYMLMLYSLLHLYDRKFPPAEST